MNNIEITNSLFEAVSIIVNEVIRNLPYDRTLIATITDNKKKDYGIYQVITRKGSTFTAYSDNSNYNVNDLVYVLIPNGDYSEKKFILSKYITGSETLDSNKEYSAFKEQEDLKQYLQKLIQNYNKIAKLLETAESEDLITMLKTQMTNISNTCQDLFKINIENLENHLTDLYGEDYFSDIPAAVRQYLATHPEVILAAVDEYLETKE